MPSALDRAKVFYMRQPLAPWQLICEARRLQEFSGGLPKTIIKGGERLDFLYQRLLYFSASLCNNSFPVIYTEIISSTYKT
jgi:hypothetical protein